MPWRPNTFKSHSSYEKKNRENLTIFGEGSNKYLTVKGSQLDTFCPYANSVLLP